MRVEERPGTTGTDGTVSNPHPPDPADLPQVLLAEDIAGIFRVSVSQARQNLAAGLYGPRFRIGKRWGMLRTALLDHLSRMSAMPNGPVPNAPDRAKAVIDLVSRRRGRIPETK